MTGTRAALLDAAYDAAVGGEWARVRMADVARAAGVSRQTLYNEFGTKESLAQALVMREVEEFIAGTERALDEAKADDPITAVRDAALYTLRRAADDPLVKAALVDDRSGLLSFLTTRGEPAMAAARASFERYYAEHWPDLAHDQRLRERLLRAELVVERLAGDTGGARDIGYPDPCPFAANGRVVGRVEQRSARPGHLPQCLHEGHPCQPPARVIT